jgi:hypothetical protein
MAIYQQRPTTIDAVEITTGPDGTLPFKPPIPAWLTDACMAGRVTWLHDVPTNITTVSLHLQAGEPAYARGITGDYVSRNVDSLALWTLTEAVLDQYWDRGPAQPAAQM